MGVAAGGKERRRRWMEREFDAIWDSLEPEIREDAERLDYRLRVVWSEAVACGVGREVAERKMRERLIRLIREIGGETGENRNPTRKTS